MHAIHFVSVCRLCGKKIKKDKVPDQIELIIFTLQETFLHINNNYSYIIGREILYR